MSASERRQNEIVSALTFRQIFPVVVQLLARSLALTGRKLEPTMKREGEKTHLDSSKEASAEGALPQDLSETSERSERCGRGSQGEAVLTLVKGWAEM